MKTIVFVGDDEVDSLHPARGVLVGVIIGAAVWGAIVVVLLALA